MGMTQWFYRDPFGCMAWVGVDSNGIWSNETVDTFANATGPITLVQRPGTDRQDAFWVDSGSSQIWYAEREGGNPWSGVAPLPHGIAGVTGAITASVVPGTDIEVLFFRGSSGEVYTQWFESSSWSNPQKLGGSPEGNIAATQIPGTTVLSLFYRGSGGVMTQWRNADGSWSGVNALGGHPVSDISTAQVPGCDETAVFYQSSLGGVGMLVRGAGPDGAWTGEQNLGGSPIGPITALALPTGGATTLALFYRGASGSVEMMTRDPHTGTFRPEQSLGGAPIGDVQAAVIPGSQKVVITYTEEVDNGQYDLMSNILTPGGWLGPYDTGGSPTSDAFPAPVLQPLVTPLTPRVPMVTWPASRPGSGSNYFLIRPDSSPIRQLSVTIDITEDLGGDVGWAFQLNCVGPRSPGVMWQQYIMKMVNSNTIEARVENFMSDWSSASSWAENIYSVAPSVVVVGGQPFQFQHKPLTQHGNVLPGGHRLEFVLSTDSAGRVNHARFMVIDPTGALKYNNNVDVLAAAGNDESRIGPITAATVVLVGPGTGTPYDILGSGCTRLNSGMGSITYNSATDPLTVTDSMPEGSHHVWTGETANSVYSLLPMGPDFQFIQTFASTKDPQA